MRASTSRPFDRRRRPAVSNLTELGSPGSRYRHFLIDLDREARVFADEVSNLLNHTVTDGIRLSAVIAPHDKTKVLLVGNRLTKHNFVPEAIPLTISARRPVGYLYAAYVLAADPEETYLAVVKSQYGLYAEDGLEGMVVHWDYEREPSHQYPAAHVQVNGECSHFDELTDRSRNAGRECPHRPLRDLHLPVGGRRFRPTLEDVVEFLIAEGFVDSRPGALEVVQQHREIWEDRQLRAAVRRNPETALRQLREDGHIA